MRLASSAILALIAASALASPAGAAIVRAKYEGEINRIGAAAPPGFSLGERVWGEFAYNTESENHGDQFMHQYPAVRQLSVRTESGFFASINTGTITTWQLATPGNLNQPAILTQYGMQLTPLPPISLIREGLDINPVNSISDDLNGNLGPQPIFIIGPDGEPILVGIVYDYPDLYELQWDIGWEAWSEGYLEAIELGFPLPAGAFTESSPFMLSLALGDEPLEHPGLPATPPGLDPTSSSTGTLHFGHWQDQRPQFAVDFNITSLTVIPEPSTLSILLTGILSLAGRIWRRPA